MIWHIIKKPPEVISLLWFSDNANKNSGNAATKLLFGVCAIVCACVCVLVDACVCSFRLINLKIDFFFGHSAKKTKNVIAHLLHVTLCCRIHLMLKTSLNEKQVKKLLSLIICLRLTFYEKGAPPI